MMATNPAWYPAAKPTTPSGVPSDAVYLPTRAAGEYGTNQDFQTARDAGWQASIGGGNVGNWDASGAYLGAGKEGRGNVFGMAAQDLGSFAAKAALMYAGVGALGGASGAQMMQGYGNLGAGGGIDAATAAGQGVLQAGGGAGSTLGNIFGKAGTMDFSLGNIGSALQIAGGLQGLFGNSGSGVNTQAQQAADPFAAYRGNLAAMYSGALQPGQNLSPTQMPGYSQWKSGVMDPAMQATQAKTNAAGMSFSTGQQNMLNQTAQQGYYGFMSDYLNRLATGSGASQSPLGGAQVGARIQSEQQQGQMQGLGALRTGLQGLGGQFGQGPTSADIPYDYNMPSYTPSPAPTDLGNFYG